jgi:hypothetical protein
MEPIWMGISPGPRWVRVLGMAGASETILKARLSPRPAHPRALPALLEAVALWEGSRVSAALAAGAAGDSCDSALYRDNFSDAGGPLYGIRWVPDCRPGRRRHRDIAGLGCFADLRQLVLWEVAR